MNLQETKLRSWFRKKGWGAFSGSAMYSVILEKGDLRIVIDPVIYPGEIILETLSDTVHLSVEEVEKIAERAGRNNERIEDFRYQQKMKKKKGGDK